MAVSGIDDGAARWIRMLPMRWAFGGFLLGIVWSSSSWLQGSFSNPVGGQLAGMVRLLLYIILPITVLSFVWGWSERSRLERAAADNRVKLEEAARSTLLWNSGKAIACGAAFGLFTYGLGHVRAFQPWTTEENIVANLKGVTQFVVLAIPVGLLVGIVARRSLLKRLRVAPETRRLEAP
jgi:hypothetical protein